jgi:uncharacterized SAM-binding protein YcdF (DUF218 family)
MAKLRHSKIEKEFLLLPIVFLSASLIFAAWLNSSGPADLRTDIKEFILKELVHSHPLPPGQVADAAYVLGGTQESLEFKYLTIAQLYKHGAIDRVWLLSRPGVTEHDSETGRNIANDEWSILELVKLGVPADKIEIIKINEGFFGTLREAEHVAELVRLRKIKTLLLISQPYHSQRVYISFKNFLPQEGFNFYIQSPNENQRFVEMAIEFFKLQVYTHLLL